MFFTSGDSDGNGGNTLWSSGSGAAKGGYFFGRGFPGRRWSANIKVGTNRFAGLVAIIMARKSRLPFIWRIRKELVPRKRSSGYISLLFFGSGGPARFHFLPCIFNIPISSIWFPKW
jgi:hypothetical protein